MKANEKAFKFKHSEVLQLIIQAHKEEIITDDERRTLKEYIVLQEPDLSTAVDDYSTDNDLKKLMESLKVVAGITIMTSPMDFVLARKKRKNNTTMSFTRPPVKIIKKTSDDDMRVFGDMYACDLGNSPEVGAERKLIFKRKEKKKSEEDEVQEEDDSDS